MYIGTGIGGIGTLLTEVEVFREKGPRRVSPFLVPMMLPDTATPLGSFSLVASPVGASCRFKLDCPKTIEANSPVVMGARKTRVRLF